MALDKEGRILVADTGNNRVQVYSADGRLAGPPPGASECTLDDPCGVGVDGLGRLVVADTGQHRVLCFRPDGSLAYSLGSDEPAKLCYPVSVAAYPGGGLAVADVGTHRVQIFDAAGGLTASLGGEGSSKGFLCGPRGVAVDAEGDVYVSDTGNHRVQRFRLDGSVVLIFGSEGSGPGQLLKPFGVALGRRGAVVVADSGNNRVQIFSSSGSVLACFGSRGRALGQFQTPYGVTVDAKGRVLVADSGNHRIQAIDLSESVGLDQGDAEIENVRADAAEGKVECLETEQRRPFTHRSDCDHGHRCPSKTGDVLGAASSALPPGPPSPAQTTAAAPSPRAPHGQRDVGDTAAAVCEDVDAECEQQVAPAGQPLSNKSPRDLSQRDIFDQSDQVKRPVLVKTEMNSDDGRAHPQVLATEIQAHPSSRQVLSALMALSIVTDAQPIGKGGWGSVFRARLGDRSIALKISAQSETIAADDHLYREADVYLRAGNHGLKHNPEQRSDVCAAMQQGPLQPPCEFALRPVTEIFGRTGLGKIRTSGGIYSVLCLPLAQDTACSVVERLAEAFHSSPCEQDWEELRGFMQALLVAVRHMHALGIAHRDLKPSNLLLVPCPEGRLSLDNPCFKLRNVLYRIFICDFGLAHVLGNEYREGRGAFSQPQQRTSGPCVQPLDKGPLALQLPCLPSSARAQTIFSGLELQREVRPAKRHRPEPAHKVAEPSNLQPSVSSVEKVTAQQLHTLFRTFDVSDTRRLCAVRRMNSPPKSSARIFLRSLGSGTPGYRPPKDRQCGENSHAYWTASDMWACGVILLDVLSAGKMHRKRREDARLGRDNKGWELLCHALVRQDPCRPSPSTLLSLISTGIGMSGSSSKQQSLQTCERWSKVLGLLGGLMAYNSADRASAQEALHHPFVAGSTASE